LDSKFVVIEEAKSKEFDYWLKLSTLKKGRRTALPITSTAVLNKWLSVPLAKLKKGCGLGIDPDGVPFVLLYVEIPKLPVRQNGKQVGCDAGQNKLVTLSDRRMYGLEMIKLLNKIDRRKKGSKGKQRALRERDNYLGYILNQLPYEELSLLVAEDLKGIKHGKNPKRSRKFRRKSAAWTVARLLERMEHKCNENRVLFATVPAFYTSQTCPECGHVAEDNRKDQTFKCVECDYLDDADVVGALNVLSRYLGSLESPTSSADVA
jgi:putative transposase